MLRSRFMKLGIIIYADQNFDKTKIPFLTRCINSVKRNCSEKNFEAHIMVGDKKLKKEIKKTIEEKISVYSDPAKKANEIISSMDCTHFIIVRYDTIFSPDFFSKVKKCKADEAMLLNYTCKVNNESTIIEYAPMFRECGLKEQLEKAPFIWNIVFSKSIVEKKKLHFSSLNNSNQYLYLINYLCYGKLKICKDVVLCFDRKVIKTNFSVPVIVKNVNLICKIAKKQKKKHNADVLIALIQDCVVPLVNAKYKQKNFAKKMAITMIIVRLTNIIGGGF